MYPYTEGNLNIFVMNFAVSGSSKVILHILAYCFLSWSTSGQLKILIANIIRFHNVCVCKQRLSMYHRYEDRILIFIYLFPLVHTIVTHNCHLHVFITAQHSLKHWVKQIAETDPFFQTLSEH